jgi:hypothetical protein
MPEWASRLCRKRGTGDGLEKYECASGFNADDDEVASTTKSINSIPWMILMDALHLHLRGPNNASLKDSKHYYSPLYR